jgi:hypothetical protein
MGTISMLIALRLRTTPISRIHARIYRCSGRGRDHADFELCQTGYLIKDKAMQDKLRNSRQPRGGNDGLGHALIHPTYPEVEPVMSSRMPGDSTSAMWRLRRQPPRVAMRWKRRTITSKLSISSG